jgi:hypothetical protein
MPPATNRRSPMYGTCCGPRVTSISAPTRPSPTSIGTTASLDGRTYMTADTVASWAASGSTPSRVYIDSMGRVRHTKTPSGTYEQTNYDPLGRALSVIRSSSTPTVTSSWTYDKRGRVSSEFADAAGYKMYSYLPTGETVQVLQNPAPGTSIADAKSVWSVQTIGSLGRVMERDDFRYPMVSYQPQMKRPMLQRHGLFWRAIACMGFSIVGAVSMAICVMQGESVLVIFICVFAIMMGFGLLLATVRCRNCERSLSWWAVSTREPASAVDALFNLEKCPYCNSP